MRTIKYSWLAVVCLLLVSLGGGGQAQKRAASDLGAVEGQSGLQGVATTNALEVTQGELAFHYRTQSDTNFGHTFLGQTFGDFPGTLTLSMNVMSATQNGLSAAGVKESVTGGTWTLAVYRTEVRGGFVGSIYGTVSQGQIIPTSNPDKSEVFMTLDVHGGTLAYQGVTGTATFVGTLTVDGRSHGNELEGSLTFGSR